MVIRELTYQLHKLEASESALVSADHHDKKSVLGIGGKNPDRSIPNITFHTVKITPRVPFVFKNKHDYKCDIDFIQQFNIQ